MADGGKQLLHEDGETMVIRHEDGSTIRIAKRGLHKYAQDQLRGMCKGGEVKGYAEGGAVEPSIADLEAGVAVQPGADLRAIGSMLSPSPEQIAARNAAAMQSNAALATQFGVAPGVMPEPPSLGDQTPGAAAPGYLMKPDAAAPMPAPGAAPQPAGPMLPDFNTYMQDVRGFQRGFSGMGGTGEAHRAAADAAQIGKNAEVEYARQQQEMAARQKQYDAEVKGFMGEFDRAVDDFKNAKIDPQRFWNSRSDGQKVSAMVGLILGGIGSGLTGGPNQALQVIEKAIDRDFEAQRMEMGKKQNLVAMLHQKFGTMDAAQNAFRMYKAAEISAYANKTAAQLGGAQARMHAAQIEQSAAQFATQNAMALAQMKMNYGFMQSVLGGQGGAGGQYAGGSEPAMPKTFDMAGIQAARAENREREIPGLAPGTTMLARDRGAADKARDRIAGYQSAHDIAGKLERLVGSAGAAIPWTDAQYQYNAMKHTLVQDIARMQGVSGAEAQSAVDKMLPGSVRQLVSGKDALKPVRALMESNRKAIYETYAGMRFDEIPGTPHGAGR